MLYVWAGEPLCSCTGAVLLGLGCSEGGGEQRRRWGLLRCDSTFIPVVPPGSGVSAWRAGLNTWWLLWVGFGPCPAVRVSVARGVLSVHPGRVSFGPRGEEVRVPGGGRRHAAL